MKAFTPDQHKRVIAILKAIVENDDEQNPGDTGYCDQEDTMEIRMLLIECGALPDRRQKVKKEKPS